MALLLEKPGFTIKEKNNFIPCIKNYGVQREIEACQMLGISYCCYNHTQLSTAT
jgi:hypothetical protein